MMIILQKMIAASLIRTTLLSLFILISLFSFFTLIDQLEDTRGNYGTIEALVYTLMTMPRMSYELFPIAAVIGSMAVFGLLARNNELDVILTSGLSRINLVALLVRSSIILVILAVLIGELVAPFAEERAQTLRSLALSENISLKTRNGFWIRDGNSYVNIRRVLPGNHIEDIYFYEFDEAYNLRSSFHAQSADYENGKWIMEDINETLLNDSAIESQHYVKAGWDSLIDPEIINVVTIKPQFLTMLGLANYINYLRQNAQNALLYEQALWVKLITPFTIIAMIVLAVPLVKGRIRETSVGYQVFIGAMIGILFHLINQISLNAGIVYNISPAISVTAPTLVLISVIIYLLRPKT
ncbi:MAG: LPS export ABC transporter permease LptG [Gammaproteobacteria bacterium]|nr:LPS export ABC transporter permease LptG [Gammaproteobacteria bacterium]